MELEPEPELEPEEAAEGAEPEEEPDAGPEEDGLEAGGAEESFLERADSAFSPTVTATTSLLCSW